MIERRVCSLAATLLNAILYLQQLITAFVCSKKYRYHPKIFHCNLFNATLNTGGLFLLLVKFQRTDKDGKFSEPLCDATGFGC